MEHDFISYAQTHIYGFSHNKRLWSWCYFHRPLCNSSSFLSRFCSLFPFQTMKTVRVQLNGFRTILEDPDLDVRLVLLVRDPRGVMESRSHREDFCPGNPDCEDPRRLCKDMVGNFHEARELLSLFPGRFRVVRYEDLAQDLDRMVPELFDFFRLPVTNSTVSFLQTHSMKEMGGVSSTYRDSKAAAVAWRTRLTHDRVREVQAACAEAIGLWGYAMAGPETDLETFHPVLNFTMGV
ncbi:unnamed protein product [Darwinula stevensoni]|uniref:Sulfotransferase domain-containing protein n=1 Tax=Darwinula stevensoni TaxID=69355 RepID=A0A7R9FP58_9CRUS|nr:unnamed protein product [Darwinula stevensoni]CAG0897601.1 unnamed protein product [Darwinula stevensoni]